MSTNQTGGERTMTETPQPRKFLFDRSFDGAVGTHQRATAAPERKPVTLKPEQVDALKKESYDAGFSAGQKTVADEATRQLTTILAQIDSRMAHLIENIQAMHKAQDAQARSAILAIAKKLLPDFTARNGLQEVEALVGTAIGEMLREPRIVVRVHESQFDAVNTRVHDITVQKAYAGKVVVLADAATAAGDCLIEWADGGIERKTAETWQDIEKAVAPDQIQNQPAGG